MPIKILIVDDQPSVRAGLTMRLKLEPDIEIVGEAGDGAEALQRARGLKPEVVVMDVEMPRLDGIAAAEALRQLTPPPAVVMLTIHDNARTRERARAAGAAAFVAKQAGDAALLAAIRAAAPSQPPRVAGGDDEGQTADV